MLTSAAVGLGGAAIGAGVTHMWNKLSKDDGVQKNIGNAAGLAASKIGLGSGTSKYVDKALGVARQVYGADNIVVQNLSDFSNALKGGSINWNQATNYGYPAIEQLTPRVAYTANLTGTNFKRSSRIKFRKKKRNIFGMKDIKTRF